MKFALAFFLISSCSLAAAQNSLGPKTIGAYDCGQWVGGSQLARAGLLGFISGSNLVTTMTLSPTPKVRLHDPLATISAPQIYLWMDNYCRANPLSALDLGGALLYEEIVKKFSDSIPTPQTK